MTLDSMEYFDRWMAWHEAHPGVSPYVPAPAKVEPLTKSDSYPRHADNDRYPGYDAGNGATYPDEGWESGASGSWV